MKVLGLNSLILRWSKECMTRATLDRLRIRLGVEAQTSVLLSEERTKYVERCLFKTFCSSTNIS